MDYYDSSEVSEVSTDFFMYLIIGLLSLITIIAFILIIKWGFFRK